MNSITGSVRMIILRYAVLSWIFCSMITGIFWGCATAPESPMANVPKMKKEELKARLNNLDLYIVDVRLNRHLKRSPHKIKGAIIENPGDIAKWWPRYRNAKTIVVYCS